jgi:glycerophosphoryl diester phosphodiesterase
MRSKIALLLFLLLSNLAALSANAGCTDPREVIRQAKDPNQTSVLIAMHRGVWGGGIRLPENSIGAFSAADHACMGAIETDVRLTKDNVPVLLHDKTLGRTTDVWKQVGFQETGFRPEGGGPGDSGIGHNPPVPDLPWELGKGKSGTSVSDLMLLSQPNKFKDPYPTNTTGYPVLSVESFYDEYLTHRLSVVVFLEIKDPKAVPIVLKQLFEDKRDYAHSLGDKKLYATELTIIKFNANIFPTPAEYRKALVDARAAAKADDTIPNPIGFPAYASNTLQQLLDKPQISDPYRDSIEKWIEDTDIRIGIELNLKEEGGILQEYYDKALQSKKVTIGTFHAAPDFLRVDPTRDPAEKLRNLNTKTANAINARDAFYQGETGACCYQLSDLLDNTTWKGKKDKRDRRPEPAFVVGSANKQGFRIITTDDYEAIGRAVVNADFKVVNKRSPLDADQIFYNDFESNSVGQLAYDMQGRTDPGKMKSPDLRLWSSMAFGTLNDRTYLFYLLENGESLKYRTFNGQWSSESDTGLPTRSRHPSVVSYKGKLYAFVYNFVTYELVFKTTSDGLTWNFAYATDRERKVPKTGALDPYATVYDGKLYVFYQGYLNDHTLYYTTFDGNDDNRWSTPQPVTQPNGQPVFVSEHPPVAIELNGKLYVFYHCIDHYMHTSIFNGSKWEFDQEIPGTFNLSEFTPAANYGYLTLYYANDKSYLARMTSPDGKNWKSWGETKPRVRLKYGPAVLH